MNMWENLHLLEHKANTHLISEQLETKTETRHNIQNTRQQQQKHFTNTGAGEPTQWQTLGSQVWNENFKRMIGWSKLRVIGNFSTFCVTWVKSKTCNGLTLGEWKDISYVDFKAELSLKVDIFIPLCAHLCPFSIVFMLMFLPDSGCVCDVVVTVPRIDITSVVFSLSLLRKTVEGLSGRYVEQ